MSESSSVESLADDGLRHALIAAAPHHDRRMIAKPQDRIARIVEKQLRVLRLDVVVLRRLPEVIPHQQSIFVGKVVERLFCVLPDPVANDVQIRIMMQTEIRLERSRETRLRESSMPQLPPRQAMRTPFTLITRYGAAPRIVNRVSNRRRRLAAGRQRRNP